MHTLATGARIRLKAQFIRTAEYAILWTKNEMNDYLTNNGHYKSHLYLFNKNVNERWHQVDIEIPHGKPLDKSKLPKELLELSVQCDYCYNCFASYSFEVYTYEDFSIKGVIKSE